MSGHAGVGFAKVVQHLVAQGLGQAVHAGEGNIVAKGATASVDKGVPGLAFNPVQIGKLGVPAGQPCGGKGANGLGAGITGNGTTGNKAGDFLDVYALLAHNQGKHGLHGKNLTRCIGHGGLLLGDRIFFRKAHGELCASSRAAPGAKPGANAVSFCRTCGRKPGPPCGTRSGQA